MTRKVFDVNRENFTRLMDESGNPYGIAKVGNSPLVALADETGTAISTSNPLASDIVVSGGSLSPQNPMPTDIESVCAEDIKDSLSDVGTFVGSSILTLFNNMDNSISNSSATNPKYFEFYLERPIRSGSIDFNAKTGNFSNVKITYKDRQGTVLHTIDDSASSTKYTSHRYDVVPNASNVSRVRVEFHTVDPVTLSFIYMRRLITVRSYVSGTRDDGTRGEAVLDNENRFMVSSQPYLYGVAEGAIAGHTPLLKFGTRTSVSAATQSLIWEGTNAQYTYLTTGEQLKVTSSSANDTAAGTGIRTLTLVGLDSNWAEYEETVTMNGVTAVTTTGSFIRIFRAYGATCGTGLTNAGNITITNNAGTVQLVYIPVGDGQTLMTMYTVPAGHVFYMVGATCSTDTNKGGRVAIYTRLNDGGTTYPFLIKYRAYVFQGNYIFPFNIPFMIPGKTDIEMRVITPAAAGTTSFGATFEGWHEVA